MISGGQAGDAEFTFGIGDGSVRVVEDQPPGGHPRVDVALHLHRQALDDLRCHRHAGPFFGLNCRVERIVTHGVGVRVVADRIVGQYFHSLIDADQQGVRQELAALLVERHLGFLRLFQRRRHIGGRLLEVNEDIGQSLRFFIDDQLFVGYGFDSASLQISRLGIGICRCRLQLGDRAVEYNLTTEGGTGCIGSPSD